MRSTKGFTTVELILAIVLFSMALSGVLYMGRGLRDHQLAMASASQQNAYATFQSQVALQGINPSLVGNPMASAINQVGKSGAVVALGANTELQISRGKLAAFETRAVTLPSGAQRTLAGSAQVDGINYAVQAAGAQGGGASAGLGSGQGLGKGTGIGFAVETTGTPVTIPTTPLVPPQLNPYFAAFSTGGSGYDLTNAPFPLNNIATLPPVSGDGAPGSNPPGTTYHYTTDGSMPTINSPLWDNNPGWMPDSFPGEVTIAAFNSDPQYSPSAAVTATFSMKLVLSFSRADGRTSNQFGFSLADLSDPADTGILLTTNVPGYPIQYTLDGSDPTVSGSQFSGAFAPPQASFNPGVILEAVAVSTDPRIKTSNIAIYDLTALTAPLTPPSFITDNSQPLSPGTPVQLTVGTGGAPRTEINNGAPSQSSSSATSFPLN